MVFMETHSGIPVSLLRKTAGSGYAWLFRHDRAWLEALPVFEVTGGFDSVASETERPHVKRKEQ